MPWLRPDQIPCPDGCDDGFTGKADEDGYAEPCHECMGRGHAVQLECAECPTVFPLLPDRKYHLCSHNPESALCDECIWDVNAHLRTCDAVVRVKEVVERRGA